MKFQITAAGLAAAFAASNSGPRIEITKFRVGSAFGWPPSVESSALQGTTLYEGPTTGYRIIDTNTCEFTLLMNESVGDFEFGEIGLFMPSGEAFAFGTLSRLQWKIAYPNQDFNRFKVTVRLTLTDVAPIIEWKVDNLTIGLIIELPTVEFLINPVDADVNAYICHSPDEEGNDPIATASGARWNISTHQRVRFRGVVTALAVDGRSLDSNQIASVGQFPLGRYFLQFTSGIQQGTLRELTGLETHKALWSTPTSGVFPGDEFEILQSNVSIVGGNKGDGSDDALFFALLIGNQFQ